jgi:hypothetical protein
MDWVKNHPDALLKNESFLPELSTAPASFSQEKHPALGSEHMLWSWIGASSDYPHIHRSYYDYYSLTNQHNVEE